MQVPQHGTGVLRGAGQGKVAHNHTLQHDGIVGIVRFIQGVGTVRKQGNRLLAHHLCNRLSGHGKIIRCTGIPGREIGGNVLEIRQIDIHQPLQTAQRLRLFICGGIVDNRNVEPMRFCLLKGGEKGGKIVGRCHQINVGGVLLVLETQENVRELPGRDGPSGSGMSDGIILTENAAHVAAGEKHGAGTGGTGDDRLFPLEQSCPGGIEPSRLAAVPGLSCGTVHTAFPRTEPAAGEIKKTAGGPDAGPVSRAAVRECRKKARLFLCQISDT